MTPKDLSVFDENVLIVANGSSCHADNECRLNAITAINSTRSAKSVLFSYDFLKKYERHSNHSGGPGIGDEFFVWLRDNAGVLPRVEIKWDTAGSPLAFPSDPDLAGFDFDDRLWVAGVKVYTGMSHIVNCVDSDYSHHKVALSANGVRVDELCPRHLKAKASKRVRRGTIGG